MSTASPVTIEAFEHARNLGPPETNVPATVSTVGGEEEATKGEKVGLVQEEGLLVGSGGTAESVLHGPHSALVSSEPCGAGGALRRVQIY